MTLLEISKKIDKSENNKDYINIEDLFNEFRIAYENYIDDDLKIEAYWIGNWYCTDSYVGFKMYFFNDEPVCYSVQEYRKAKEKFYWFNEDCALKVKKYLFELLIEDEETNVEYIDINQEVNNGYQIYYNSNILRQNQPTYKGKDVTIINRVREKGDLGIDTKLKINYEGKEKIADIRDLVFKYYLKEK